MFNKFGISLVLILFLTTGCATKKFLRSVVNPIEKRVETAESRATDLERKSAENSSAINQLEAGVSKADERAMEADKKAVAAGRDAQRANEEATQAARRAEEARTRAEDARALAEKGIARIGDVVENLNNYKLVTTESVLFQLNSSSLNGDARERLDGFFKNLADISNYLIEVQGFTDKTGSPEHNIELSRRRANSVVHYLAVGHKVPLRRIHVMGAGDAAPISDNGTRTGRKENRRVEVKVYHLNLQAGARESAASTSASK